MLDIICTRKIMKHQNQSEGLDEIIHIEFAPKFDSETHEKIFNYYTES